MTDEWSEVEAAFARLDRHASFFPTLAAMRRIAARIKLAELHDLRPSVSHASLVFRRSSRRGVMVHWSEADGYMVSHLDPGFEIVDTRSVSEERVVQVLRAYLDGAAG